MTALEQSRWSECIYFPGWALPRTLRLLTLVGSLAAVLSLTFAKTQARTFGPVARVAAKYVMGAVTLPDERPGPGTRPPSESISGDLRPYLRYYGAAGTGLRAGFVPAKAVLVKGELLEVTFTVENTGRDQFQFYFGGDSRGKGRHDRFKIDVTDADGKSLPDPRARFGNFGGLGSFQTLKPGQTFTNTIDLTHFRTFDGPGVYTVSCRFAFDEPGVVRKGPAIPVVETRFQLTILERTPGRVARVLDGLVARAQSGKESDVAAVFASIARFGQNDAVPRLVRLAEKGPISQRTAALATLGQLPTDASFNFAVTALKDADPIIRAAAAGALGAMRRPGTVTALLAALPSEKPPVADAILVALGNSKSDRALPVLVRTIDQDSPLLKSAAVTALVAHGGPAAVAALQKHVESSDLSLRYRVIRALAENFHQPVKTVWLLPVLMRRSLDSEWLDTLRLLRLYGGERAIGALVSGLDFEVPWSWRNRWILYQVEACPKAPAIVYTHDPNREGTPAELEQNRRTLADLKKLAGPIPTLALAPRPPRVPYLKTDPPIDFEPTLKPVKRAVEIKSGFLQVTLNRTSCTSPYTPSDAHRPIYQLAQQIRWLVRFPDLYPKLGITAQQAEQLGRLPPASEWPSGAGWTQLYIIYKEAPPGPLQKRAHEDLCDAIRVASQEHHAAAAELARAARKVLTADQLRRLPDLVEQRRQAPERPARKPAAGSGAPARSAAPEGR
jgi:HEAT repeat protein